MVDDEQDVLSSIAALAEAHLPDIRATFVQSGPAALEVLTRERVGLLITDFKMPVMNGDELIAKARRQRPGLPALIMTAFSDPRAMGAVSAMNSVTLLEKPFETDDFLRAVRSLLASGQEAGAHG